MPLKSSAFTLGLFSDIHAGEKKVRNGDLESAVYPKNYKNNIKYVLKHNKFDIVISLGDSTNSGSKKEAQKVKKSLNPKNAKVIWVKGNHDRKKAWDVFKTGKDTITDKGNWRIIKLDTSSKNPSTSGFISESQLLWLEEQLKTKNKVIIAMHHNPYHMTNMTLYPVYEKFKDIIEQSGNVEYVITGHTHTYGKCHEEKGIKYCGVRALSLKKHEGSFMKLELE